LLTTRFVADIVKSRQRSSFIVENRPIRTIPGRGADNGPTSVCFSARLP